MSHLESTIPPITPVAWRSFMTGKNPGSHGSFDFYHMKPGSYDRVLATSFLKKSRTLWRILSDYGKKCVVFNVPHTYPPEKINGCIVSGFLSPSIHSEFTYPKDCKVKLLKNIPEYKIHSRLRYSEIKSTKEKFIDELFDMADIHIKAAQFLMNEYKWDFYMMYFRQTDIIQHYLWKYMDKNHPLFEKKESIKYGKKILEIYEKVDAFLSYILKRYTEQTNIIIMSDHGFGPSHEQFHINNWLFKYGYLKMKKTPHTILKQQLASLGLTKYSLQKLLSIFRSELRKDGSVKKSTVNMRETLLKTILLSLEDIDWGRTTAFSFGTCGQIYINVKDRFPKGNVKNVLEYEKIKSEIKKKILNMDGSKDSKKIIDKIWFKEDIYFGPYVKDSPDILFSPTDYSLSSSYDELGSKRLISKPINDFSGSHRLDGILVMRGPNIKKECRIGRSQIIDLHPTIMHLFGCPVDYSPDGKILREALASSESL